MSRKKKAEPETVLYRNSAGEFKWINGKLFDSEGNKVKSCDVSSKSDPLKRIKEAE